MNADDKCFFENREYFQEFPWNINQAYNWLPVKLAKNDLVEIEYKHCLYRARWNT